MQFSARRTGRPLSSIHDSSKVADELKISKYGVGFRSVFKCNMTVVLSQNYLIHPLHQPAPSPLPPSTFTSPAASIAPTPRSEPILVDRNLTVSEVTTISLKSFIKSAEDLPAKSFRGAVICIPSTFTDARNPHLKRRHLMPELGFFNSWMIWPPPSPLRPLPGPTIGCYLIAIFALLSIREGVGYVLVLSTILQLLQLFLFTTRPGNEHARRGQILAVRQALIPLSIYTFPPCFLLTHLWCNIILFFLISTCHIVYILDECLELLDTSVSYLLDL